MRFSPPIQNSSHYFSQLKQTYRTQSLTSTEHHISSLHSHFWVQLRAGSPFLSSSKTRKFFWFFIINIIVIRECTSTLYSIGLAHVIPPTKTNSSRYFSRFKRVYHTQTLTSIEHHISSLHSHLWVQLSTGSPFLLTDKNRKFLRFFHHQYSLCTVGTCCSTH